MATRQSAGIGPRTPNNWGRWGPEDERGTANFIEPPMVRRAAGLIRTGEVISCALGIDPRTTPMPPDRAAMVHLYAWAGTDFLADAVPGVTVPVFSGTDDYCFMPLQTGTHWDAFAHSHYQGLIYNGYSVGTISAFAGARRGSIHHLQQSLVGRGVLLDMATLANQGRLEPGHAITPAELDAVARQEGVAVGRGDILLVRTGHLGWYHMLKDKGEFWRAGSPGIGQAVVEWLYEREVAALAMDNVGIEVVPHEDPTAGPYPLHSRLLRDLGLVIGELWDLDRLAEACASDARYEFFLSAPPLGFHNASGSPTNPIAVR